MRLLERIQYDPVFYALRVLVLFLVLVLFSVLVFAQPLAVAESDGVRITLFDEECKSEVVKNLAYRITWSEKGQTYEGCFSVHHGIVVAYFHSDKTVAIFPGSAFKRVNEL